MSSAEWAITPEWGLLLDRDGVINRRLPDDYVRDWSQFEFLPGVLEAMPRLASLFGTILVVTNQRGIGRGLMSETDLSAIHAGMIAEVRKHGGRIDAIYHCPHDSGARCPCRKPAIGLALRAKREFPALDLVRSIMVGDSPSDMEFAQRAGLRRVWIGGEPGVATPSPEQVFPSLAAFSRSLLGRVS